MRSKRLWRAREPVDSDESFARDHDMVFQIWDQRELIVPP